MNFKKQIPNLFTLGNLYCGYLSIGYTASNHYKNAAIFILIGMLLDSIDGRIARLLHVESPLGKELDSLADIITFGVAPSFLMYYTMLFDLGWIGLAISGLFPLFGGYRLARYNITAKEESLHHFTGIPITIAGGILATLILFREDIPSTFTMVIFILLCFLMVSTIQIPSLKKVRLPRNETIVTILIGMMLFMNHARSWRVFTSLLYIVIPLYLIYMTYRFIKIKASR